MIRSQVRMSRPAVCDPPDRGTLALTSHTHTLCTVTHFCRGNDAHTLPDIELADGFRCERRGRSHDGLTLADDLEQPYRTPFRQARRCLALGLLLLLSLGVLWLLLLRRLLLRRLRRWLLRRLRRRLLRLLRLLRLRRRLALMTP